MNGIETGKLTELSNPVGENEGLFAETEEPLILEMETFIKDLADKLIGYVDENTSKIQQYININFLHEIKSVKSEDFKSAIEIFLSVHLRNKYFVKDCTYILDCASKCSTIFNDKSN